MQLVINHHTMVKTAFILLVMLIATVDLIQTCDAKRAPTQPRSSFVGTTEDMMEDVLPPQVEEAAQRAKHVAMALSGAEGILNNMPFLCLSLVMIIWRVKEYSTQYVEVGDDEDESDRAESTSAAPPNASSAEKEKPHDDEVKTKARASTDPPPPNPTETSEETASPPKACESPSQEPPQQPAGGNGSHNKWEKMYKKLERQHDLKVSCLTNEIFKLKEKLFNGKNDGSPLSMANGDGSTRESTSSSGTGSSNASIATDQQTNSASSNSTVMQESSDKKNQKKKEKKKEAAAPSNELGPAPSYEKLEKEVKTLRKRLEASARAHATAVRIAEEATAKLQDTKDNNERLKANISVIDADLARSTMILKEIEDTSRVIPTLDEDGNEVRVGSGGGEMSASFTTNTASVMSPLSDSPSKHRCSMEDTTSTSSSTGTNRTKAVSTTSSSGTMCSTDTEVDRMTKVYEDRVKEIVAEHKRELEAMQSNTATQLASLCTEAKELRGALQNANDRVYSAEEQYSSLFMEKEMQAQDLNDADMEIQQLQEAVSGMEAQLAAVGDTEQQLKDELDAIKMELETAKKRIEELEQRIADANVENNAPVAVAASSVQDSSCGTEPSPTTSSCVDCESTLKKQQDAQERVDDLTDEVGLLKMSLDEVRSTAAEEKANAAAAQQKLEEELADVRASHDQLKADFSALQTDSQSKLQDELSARETALKEEHNRMQDELEASHVEKTNVLESRLHHLEEEMSHLTKEKDDLQKQTDLSLQLNTDLKQELEAIKQQHLNQCAKLHDDHTISVEVMEKEKRMLEYEVVKLSASVKTARDESEERCKRELEELKEQQAEKAKEYKELEASHKLLAEVELALQESKETATQLEQEVREKNEKLQALEDSQKAHDASLHTTQEQLSEKLNELLTINKQLDVAEMELSEAKKELQLKEAAHEQHVQQLQEQLNSLQKDHQSASGELQTTKQALHDFEAEAKDQAAQAAEVQQSLKKALSSMEDELGAAKAQLAEAQNQFKITEEQLGECQAAVALSKSSEEKVTTLHRDLENARKELLGVTSQLDEKTTALTAVNDELEATKKELQSTEEELASTKLQLLDVEKRANGQEEQHSEAMTELKTVRAQHEEQLAAAHQELNAAAQAASEMKETSATEVTSLKKQLDITEKELLSTKNDLTAAQAKEQALTQQVCDLDVELDATKRELEAGQQHLSSTEEELVETKAKVDAAQRDSSELQEQLEAAKSSLQSVEESLIASKSSEEEKVAVLEKDLETAKKETNDLTTQLDEKATALNEATENLATTQQDLEVAKTEKAHELQVQLDDAVSQLDEVRTARAKEAEQVVAVRQELDGVTKAAQLAAETKEELTSELASMKEALHTTEQDLLDTKEELQSAEQRLKASETHQDTLTQQVNGLNADLKEKCAAADTAQSQLEAAQRELRTITENHQRAEERLLSLQTQLNDVEQQLDSKDKELSTAAHQSTQLQQQLDALRQELEHCKEESSDLMKELEATAQTNKELQEETRELKTQLESAVEEKDTVKKQTATVDAELISAKTQLDEVTKLLQAEQETLRATTTELDAAHNQAVSGTEQVDQLQHQLDAAEEAKTTLEAEVHRLEAKAAKTQEIMRGVIEKQSENAKADTTKLHEVEEALQSVKTELASTAVVHETAMARKSAEKGALQSELDATKAELVAKTAAAQQFEQEAAEKRAAAEATYQKQITQLQSTLEASGIEREKAESTMETLKTECNQHVATLQAEHAASITELQIVQEEALSSLKTQHSSLQDKCDTLSKELDAASQEKKKLEERCNTLEDEANKLKQDALQSEEAFNEKLETTLTAKEEEHEAAMDDLQFEADKAAAKSIDLKKELRTIENLLEAERDTNDKLKEQHSDVEKLLTDAHRVMKDLRQEQQAHEARANAAAFEVEALKAELLQANTTLSNIDEQKSQRTSVATMTHFAFLPTSPNDGDETPSHVVMADVDIYNTLRDHDAKHQKLEKECKELKAALLDAMSAHGDVLRANDELKKKQLDNSSPDGGVSSMTSTAASPTSTILSRRSTTLTPNNATSDETVGDDMQQELFLNTLSNIPAVREESKWEELYREMCTAATDLDTNVLLPTSWRVFRAAFEEAVIFLLEDRETKVHALSAMISNVPVVMMMGVDARIVQEIGRERDAIHASLARVVATSRGFDAVAEAQRESIRVSMSPPPGSLKPPEEDPTASYSFHSSPVRRGPAFTSMNNNGSINDNEERKNAASSPVPERSSSDATPIAINVTSKLQSVLSERAAAKSSTTSSNGESKALLQSIAAAPTPPSLDTPAASGEELFTPNNNNSFGANSHEARRAAQAMLLHEAATNGKLSNKAKTALSIVASAEAPGGERSHRSENVEDGDDEMVPPLHVRTTTQQFDTGEEEEEEDVEKSPSPAAKQPQTLSSPQRGNVVGKLPPAAVSFSASTPNGGTSAATTPKGGAAAGLGSSRSASTNDNLLSTRTNTSSIGNTSFNTQQTDLLDQTSGNCSSVGLAQGADALCLLARLKKSDGFRALHRDSHHAQLCRNLLEIIDKAKTAQQHGVSAVRAAASANSNTPATNSASPQGVGRVIAARRQSVVRTNPSVASPQPLTRAATTASHLTSEVNRPSSVGRSFRIDMSRGIGLGSVATGTVITPKQRSITNIAGARSRGAESGRKKPPTAASDDVTNGPFNHRGRSTSASRRKSISPMRRYQQPGKGPTDEGTANNNDGAPPQRPTSVRGFTGQQAFARSNTMPNNSSSGGGGGGGNQTPSSSGRKSIIGSAWR